MVFDQGAFSSSNNNSYTDRHDTQDNDVDQHDQAVTDASGDTYGAKWMLTESNGNTFTTSDFGAIEAARQIALGGTDAANRAADAARRGFDQVAELFRLKGEGDITKILRPLAWVAVAIAFIFVLGPALLGKKKKGA